MLCRFGASRLATALGIVPLLALRSATRGIRAASPPPPPPMGGHPPPPQPPGGAPDGGRDAPDMETADDADDGPREPVAKPTEPPKFFKFDKDENGTATVLFNRPPINAFSLEFFEEFNQWMMWMGDAEEVRAVVLGSAVPLIYSAGLDMAELLRPKEDRFAMFWSAAQHFFITLHTFPKPLIAAISGNCPAAGCMAALGCDYRIMATHPSDKPDRPFRIGLNETKLGMVAPPWAMASLAYAVGKRRAERMLQLGETPTAAEAVQIGLIDEAVAEADVLPRAAAAVKRFTAVNNNSRWLTRDIMRGEIMYHLGDRETQEQDIQFAMNMAMNPDVQKSINDYVSRLQGNKK